MADDARNANGLLPRLPLQPRPMGSQHVAVIGRYDHDRVVAEAEIVQLGQDASDLIVDGSHHCVVRGNLLAAWSCDVRVRLEISFRVVAGKIGAQGDRIGIVHRHVLFRGQIGVVWRAHLDGKEERAAVRPRLTQEFNANIRPRFGFERLDRDGVGIVAEVVCVEVGVADLVGRPEFESLPSRSRWNPARLARAAVQVPLTNEARAVARLGKQFGHGGLGLSQAQIVRGHSIRVGVFAGQDNRPGRTADRGVGVMVAEQNSFLGKPVEIGRLHVWLAHAAHGLRPHLVGEQEKDVQRAVIAVLSGLTGQCPEDRSACCKEFAPCQHTSRDHSAAGEADPPRTTHSPGPRRRMARFTTRQRIVARTGRRPPRPRRCAES